MAETGKKDSGPKKEPDITFFHPELLEVPTDGSRPFLKGYRCKKCGQLDFPKLSPCPNCWGEEFEMVPLSRTGKLYAFTEIYFGQPGVQAPYTFAYVDLPENLRIFAQLEGEVKNFRCDEEVELTTGPIRTNNDGLPVISYQFRKATA